MDDRNDLGSVEHSCKDLEEGSHNVYSAGGEEEDDPLRLLSHSRAHAHDRAHVDLLQEEYTPEEAARLIGTSIDVIMHAVRDGELQAEKAGHKVVCIKHADLADWLKRQGPTT
jgi:excisionase family DNA binding protein